MNEKLNRVKIVLAEKGITQRDLADAIGRNVNTVAAICNNKHQPHLSDLKRIADYLDVDLRDLVASTKQ